MPDPIVTLGKQLISELGMSTSCDTLARWLVHDVASLMQTAETVAETDKPAAREKCRAAILELLSHIHALPSEARHLQSDVAIMEALSRLAPKHINTFGYFATITGDANLEDIPEDSASLLKTASIVDSLSRRLIRTCIRHAARTALDQDAHWVKAVKNIEGYDLAALRRIELVAYPADPPSQDELIAETQRRVRERRASELEDIQTMRKLLDDFEEIIENETDDY